MKKRLLALLLCLCLLPALPATAAESGHSGDLAMAKLSREEIAQLLRDNPLGYAGEAMAQPASTTAPYALGQVSDAALNTALGRFNALRRLAGLGPVTLDAEFTRRSQHGAVLLAATGKLTHHPDKPADMDEEFYQWGHNATSCCNIYQGTGATLPQAVEAFFDDSDAGNLPMLGHRRWMLSPTMSKTGFGFAPSRYTYGATPYHFAALWAFDRTGPAVDYDFIAWPASGYFPSNVFASDQAWSVTLDPAKYAVPDLRGLTVTLTRASDGKVWVLNGAGAYVPTDAGEYLGVNTDNYAVGNAIIFRPQMEGKGYDGLYTVDIQGLQRSDGTAASLAYQVEFFDPNGFSGGQAPVQGPVDNSGAQKTVFTDVAAGSWYEDAVAYAVSRGLFNGVGGNRFAPDDPMTRAMVMTVLARLDGEDTTPYMFGETWDLKGRRWAVTNRISDGLNSGQAITLEELATMLYRYAQLRCDASAAHNYHLPGMPDGDLVASWAADGANWAVDEGILIGDENQRLNPQRPATRAQVAIILQRFLED